jgi:general secretion pathway protein E
LENFINLDNLDNLLPYDFVKLNKIIAFSNNDKNSVFSQGPISSILRRELRLHFGDDFSSEFVDEDVFNKILTKVYAFKDQENGLEFSEFEEHYDLDSALNSIAPTEDLLSGTNDAPITKLINAIISDAITKRASDIHFEPYESFFSVRFRIDGKLVEIFSKDIRLAQPITSRLKIISMLDIAERRKPQDGRISLSLGNKKIDVRISTLPSSYGERVVLRILDKESANVDIDSLGYNDEILSKYKNLLNCNEGIILVTGPTGSGKTTTLYAGLQFLNGRDSNILTVEDPIEYTLPGIGQTQVNAKTGYSFASGLRSILRQDPDIVMVGEIRDKDTATTAIQASLTGHLVLSTVHTNSAIGAITRLRDIGVASYLLASSIKGILAQRLLRKLCNNCKVERLVNSIEIEAFGLENDEVVFDAQGCANCLNTGYLGRIPIAEVITINDELKSKIHSELSEQEIYKDLSGNNLSLKSSIRNLLLAGVISPAEALAMVNSNNA